MPMHASEQSSVHMSRANRPNPRRLGPEGPLRVVLFASESVVVEAVRVALNGLEGSVVVEHVRRESKANWGFDVMAEAYINLVEAGIIDPAKVTRCALENAASVAGMILSPKHSSRMCRNTTEWLLPQPQVKCTTDHRVRCSCP
jgi:hypothetical protein